MSALLLAALVAVSGQVRVTDRALTVEGKIYFETGSAAIKAESLPLVDELAKALRDNPRFDRISIEGHTDATGNAARNRALSLARAGAVKAALVARGVAKGRLTTAGYGGDQPIATNDTEVGRRLNRRVEFVVGVLGAAGKRPPTARVSYAYNRVEAREPDREAWRRAEVGLGLYRLWRVQARERSAGEVTFRDASTVQLREDTLVIIYGATSERARRVTSRATLERGALRTRLDELAGQSVTVETPTGEAEFQGGTGLIAVYGDTDESVLSNHAGKGARLRSKKKKSAVRVKPGFGSKVKRGARPTPPRPLPPPPSWEQAPPPVLAGFGPVEVRAAWSAVEGAAYYRVEFLRDGQLVEAVDVPASTRKVWLRSLPTGSYEIKVATRDQERFEGVPSAPATFTLVSFDAQPGAVEGSMRALPGSKVGSEGLSCAPSRIEAPGPVEVRCRSGDAELPPFTMEGTEVRPRAKRPIHIPRGSARGLQLPLSSPVDLEAVTPEIVPPRGVKIDGAPVWMRFGLNVRLVAEADAPEFAELSLRVDGVEVGRIPLRIPR